MAELSGVFADSPLDTAEDLARLFRQFAPSGVVPAGSGVQDPTDPGDELEVTGNGTGLVTIGTGYALVGGYWYRVTAPITRPVQPNTAGQERLDLVVVRADPQTGAATVVIIPGTPGSGTPPSPTREGAGVWDVVLAVVTVAGNSSVVVPGDVDTRPREYTSSGAVPCHSTHRPTAPHQGMLIHETDTGRILIRAAGTWTVVAETSYPTRWQPIQLRAGYSNPGHGYTPAWRWDAPGVVRLRGRVMRGAGRPLLSGEYVARLPSEARPSMVQGFAVASASRGGSTASTRGTTSRLEVRSRNNPSPDSGRLIVYTHYDPTWVGLDGVTFIV